MRGAAHEGSSLLAMATRPATRGESAGGSAATTTLNTKASALVAKWTLAVVVVVACCVLAILALAAPGGDVSRVYRMRQLEHRCPWKERSLGFCPILMARYDEAYAEAGLAVSIPRDSRYAIYPMRLVNEVREMDHNKTVDFFFQGGYLTDSPTEARRAWVVEYARENFTTNSYLQFTDEKSKSELEPVGPFDYTREGSGYVPKEHPIEERVSVTDTDYFSGMTKAKFCLCPAGDEEYSMRFYEAIMSGCIPVVRSCDETYRTSEEWAVPYRYYLTNEDVAWDPAMVEDNMKLFLKYHTLNQS